MASIAKSAKPQVSVFEWKGTDRRGSKMKGEITSKSSSLVKAELRRQGITPRVVRKKAKPIFGAAGKPIKAQEIALFSRQMATMLSSGVPLVQSFEIIAGGLENPRTRQMVLDIKTDVESGTTLSEALARHPAQFDELYVNLVRTGEMAGVLDTMLDNIATYKERIEEIKGKIKKALYYPAAVIAVAAIVSAILLIYVVPMFEKMFKNFGADLPAFTQAIVDASRFMQSNGLLVLIAIIAFFVGFGQAKKRSRKFARAIDRMSLQIPVVGNILNKAAIARFARTLATTFAAGVPLVEALDTVAGATGNSLYEEATLRIKEDVSTGHQLQLAMKQVNIFPHMVVQMTAIGEEAGSLDAMLNKVADYYENEVSDAVDSLSALLEPLIIVLIGGLVGSMVVGMYLPVFKMASVI